MRHAIETCRTILARKLATTLRQPCRCGGQLKKFDAYQTSCTGICSNCGGYSLIVMHADEPRVIPLRRFGIIRRNAVGQTPIRDTGSAKELVECFDLDVWPSWPTIEIYGIKSSEHYCALQCAYWCGCTVYDFDRVRGDGNAITELVQSVSSNTYDHVVFQYPLKLCSNESSLK